MWLDNEIFRKDLEAVVTDSAIPWGELNGKRILITGATGLIGTTLVSALLYYGMTAKNPPQVLALVRSEEKARGIFRGQLADCGGNLAFLLGDICTLPEIPGSVDYIIHGACQTASKAFVEKPVETTETSFAGTKNLLELAKEKQCKGFVYLSSMEVYGYPERGLKVTEDMIGALTPLKPRNCYPLSKQMCENMCCSYYAEYQVPAKIARLTQTFGPGVAYNDDRVFAEFARCVMEKKDIVLKTKGETERDYLYTADAASALLLILLRGTPGDAYNVANEDSYCSIAQMAAMVAEMGDVPVRFDIQDTEALGYAQTMYKDLNVQKLRNLGWTAHTGLADMYRRMIACMK